MENIVSRLGHELVSGELAIERVGGNAARQALSSKRGVMQRVSAFLNEGTGYWDPDTNAWVRTGEGLKPILKKVPERIMRRRNAQGEIESPFDMLRVALREQELYARKLAGDDTIKITQEQAMQSRASIGAFRKQEPEYADQVIEAARAVTKWDERTVLDQLASVHAIEKGSIKAKNLAYARYSRVDKIIDDYIEETIGPEGLKDLKAAYEIGRLSPEGNPKAVHAPIKALRSGKIDEDTAILRPTQASVARLRMVLDWTEGQRVRNVLGELMDANRPDYLKHTVHRFIESGDVTPEKFKSLAARWHKSGEGFVQLLPGGKKRLIQLKDPDLMRAMSNLTAGDASMLAWINAMQTPGKVGGFAARLFRIGHTLAPALHAACSDS